MDVLDTGKAGYMTSRQLLDLVEVEVHDFLHGCVEKIDEFGGFVSALGVLSFNSDPEGCTVGCKELEGWSESFLGHPGCALDLGPTRSEFGIA